MNEFGVVFVEAAFVVFELNGTSMAANACHLYVNQLLFDNYLRSNLQ